MKYFGTMLIKHREHKKSLELGAWLTYMLSYLIYEYGVICTGTMLARRNIFTGRVGYLINFTNDYKLIEKDRWHLFISFSTLRHAFKNNEPLFYKEDVHNAKLYLYKGDEWNVLNNYKLGLSNSRKVRYGGKEYLVQMQANDSLIRGEDNG